MSREGSLRDRKRARTRHALVEAATDLFESKGYDETTVADIAASAEIGTRTFFSYFPSKEEVRVPISAAAAMSATVVPSYPFRSKRSTAASTRACRVRARFRSRSDTIHILRHAWQVGTHCNSALDAVIVKACETY